MHNSESVVENETHKLSRDFKIQTDHLISTRRPDIVIVNNKKEKFKKKTPENLSNSGLCCHGKPHDKTERKRKGR